MTTIENKETIDAPVLVTGATGKQGGAVTRTLLAQNKEVRALVRDLNSKDAEELKSLGASLVLGNLKDKQSLLAACSGVRAVFSVQMPEMNDLGSDAEQVMGKNLVEAAKEAGVLHFVHSSVSGAGEYARNAPGWKENRWDTHYWESKAYTEDLVRNAGFKYWTVIKPAFFMENFTRPSFLFANWTDDRFLTILKPDTVLALVAVKDIGQAAAAAINDPENFNQVNLELAGDRINMKAIAKVLSDAWDISIKAPSLSNKEAIAQGMMPVFIGGQEWLNEVGSPATPEQAHSLGLTTTDFKTWANT